MGCYTRRDAIRLQHNERIEKNESASHVTKTWEKRGNRDCPLWGEETKQNRCQEILTRIQRKYHLSQGDGPRVTMKAWEEGLPRRSHPGEHVSYYAK